MQSFEDVASEGAGIIDRDVNDLLTVSTLVLTVSTAMLTVSTALLAVLTTLLTVSTKCNREFLDLHD